jgi:hypothetical protein
VTTDLTGGTDPRVVLEGFLDWFRGVAEHKLDGLTRDQVTEVAMPSGTTMLGIVKHLAWDERTWFRHYFRGEPHEGIDVDESFVIGPGDTIEWVVDHYRDACAHSRRIVSEASSLDALATVEHRVFGTVTLGWILTHMLEETARHAGHLDILRELTDGHTGD